MRTSTSAALWIVRAAGLIQLVLGVLFWTRNALSLVPVHMLIGTILVIGLWFLSFQAIQSGANPGLGLLSILWGLLTVALGMTQARFLPGQMHWIIQVAHLLVGMGAIGLADNMARSVSGGRVAVR